MSGVSPASSYDAEKDEVLTHKGDDLEAQPHLTQEQQDLREAAQPPFTKPEDGVREYAQEQDGSQLEPVQSVRPSINNIKSVPNGGTTAWLQVLASFFLFFNSWGIVNTFGTYQTYYETGILAGTDPGTISWIGSVQSFLLMFTSAVTGPVYDAGYVHTLLLAGSFLVVFGQMMLSLATEFWQVMLAQAICVGLGCGCLFVPGVAILSTYFSTRIATAMGLAASGSSLGGVLYPIVFYRLQPTIGFPWATRVIGFIALAGLCVSNLVFKVRVLPASRRAFFDISAFREPPWVLFVLGSFLGFAGLYVLFFYIQSFAIETAITSPSLAFYLLAILNSASVFGRIIPNYIADRTGPLNMIVPCAFLAGILTLCLIPTTSPASLITICVLYGFFSGTFVSLPPTIFVHLTKNRALIGTRMGMGFGIVSFGLLIGTPISGAILSATGFKQTWVFGGVMILAGAGVIGASRVAQGGWKIVKKV